jgi:hypothetical protein
LEPHGGFHLSLKVCTEIDNQNATFELGFWIEKK